MSTRVSASVMRTRQIPLRCHLRYHRVDIGARQVDGIDVGRHSDGVVVSVAERHRRATDDPDVPGDTTLAQSAGQFIQQLGDLGAVEFILVATPHARVSERSSM
jgi:hypothetical protein